MSCGHSREDHGEIGCKCHLCAGFFDPDSEDAKRLLSPPDSASSSPDNPCRNCGHSGSAHLVRETHGQRGCQYQILDHEIEDRRICPCGFFWPAHLSMAGPIDLRLLCPCGCPKAAHMGRPEGCIPHGFHPYGAASAPAEPDAAQEAAMQELIDLRQEIEAESEPEAPECEHEWGDWHRVPSPGDSHYENRQCARCRAWDNENLRILRRNSQATKSEAQPPRRPPYAVAYATDDGTQYEVALPGDATVCAHEGALVITHGSAVQALLQIRPMEGA